MNRDLDFTDDYIDVRNIIARVEELREEREALQDAIESDEYSMPDSEKDARNNLQSWIEDNGTELKTLEALLADLKGNGGDEQWEGDWYPVTLIRDSHFNDAMDEMLEDIGVIPKDLPGYLSIAVDYKALQMDYSSVEIDGVTYWYR